METARSLSVAWSKKTSVGTDSPDRDTSVIDGKMSTPGKKRNVTGQLSCLHEQCGLVSSDPSEYKYLCNLVKTVCLDLRRGCSAMKKERRETGKDTSGGVGKNREQKIVVRG